MLSNSSDPVCERCKSTSSLIWQRDQKGAVICLDCYTTEKTATKATASLSSVTSESPPLSGKQSSPHKASSRASQQVSSSSSSSSVADTSSSGVTTRRTTRSHERAKAKQQQLQQQDLAKIEASATGSEEADNAAAEDQLVKDKNKSLPCDLGKTFYNNVSNKADSTQNSVNSGGPPSPCSSTSSRRSLRQGQPVQAPVSQPFVLTCSSLEHQGVVYEVGDVVSLLDRDGGVYYAILRGFLCDQYANKFCVITWLLPKLPNPSHFDPAMFILGPEEDIPRSMDQLDFVCHSPQSRHFQDSYNQNLQEAELWLSSIR